MAGLQQAFGEPVTYQAAQGGVPAGDPFQVTAIRRARPQEESGPKANFEEISVNPSDPGFSNPPAKGDWVSAWGVQYVVMAIKQPFAYGMVVLVLQQRAGQVIFND